jgi:integrase
MRLSRQSVAELTLPSGRPYVIVWDSVQPGFGVRVNAGNKTWVVQYRFEGQSRRQTLGRVGVVTLDQAREAARKILASVQLGSDPKPSPSQVDGAIPSLTVGDLADRYLRHRKSRLKPRSLEEVTRHLKSHWRALENVDLKNVTRAAISARLEEISDDSGPIASNRARAAISAMFNYALAMGLAESNPVVGTLKHGREIARDRVLSDLELRAVWQAGENSEHGRIVRLLMLLGQRREEVAAMRWSELDLDARLWAIPRERTKNRLAHEVPLSDMAISILNQQPRLYNRDLVFGSGTGGFSGWSKAKKKLDDRIAKGGQSMSPWRLHDLRRTAATKMVELGVQPHVVEAVLNHISGHKSGVAGVYNRASYSSEKRDALAAWSMRLQTIMS